MAFKSLKSTRSNPWSSAIRNTADKTPSWVSFKLSIRANKIGPISEIVVRIGWPCWPNKSQKTTGLAANGTLSICKSFKRSLNLSEASPAFARLETSPFASARKTGTPIREKLSASTFRVTVLPVPVAPAIRPCRLAIGKVKQFLLMCR